MTVLGVHYRVGIYKNDFHVGLEEYVNFPLFVSLAGQDGTVGEPFIGFNMIRYLLDHGKLVDFHFMPTGTHHLIPKGLLRDDKKFPEGDWEGYPFAQARKYATSICEHAKSSELYGYVAFKTRIWGYFLSLTGEAGAPPSDLFVPGDRKSVV